MAPLSPRPTLVHVEGVPFWLHPDGRILPVLAGADDGPAPIFPEVPADLTTLNGEALADLIDQYTDLASRATRTGDERDEELVGTLTTAQIIEQVTAGLAARDQLEAEQAKRAEASEAEAETLAALSARASGPDPDKPDEDDDAPGDPASDDPTTESVEVEVEVEVKAEVEDETADETEQVAVAASSGTANSAASSATLSLDTESATALGRAIAAGIRPRDPARLPAPGRDRRPVRSQAHATLTAAADIPGMPMGSELDRDGLAKAMVARHQHLGRSSVSGEQVPVATFRAEYPEERHLGRELQLNEDRISGVVGPAALTASGGICAPPEPFYDLEVVAVADRPVRDALPSFQAERGGILYMPNPTLAGLAGAIGVITAAEDAAGGAPGTKPCIAVDCPTPVTKYIEAISRCLTFGNFNARTWPEQVAAWTDLAIAMHARVAETELLDAIKAASTAVTGASFGGATTTLVDQVAKIAAGMRSRHRMAPGANLRALIPAWVADALPVDLMRSSREYPDVTRDQVGALLARHGVNVTWYIDGATGDGMVFGTQAAGAISEFPTTIKYGIFPEGSHLFLDGGTLDLGLVRDSTLNATNDFNVFAETFEGHAYRGIESLWVTATACYSGQVQEPGKLVACAKAPAVAA